MQVVTKSELGRLSPETRLYSRGWTTGCPESVSFRQNRIVLHWQEVNLAILACNQVVAPTLLVEARRTFENRYDQNG